MHERIRLRLMGPVAPYDFVGEDEPMGLITGLLGLPLAPLRGTSWRAEQIREQAEEEFYDPATIRPSSRRSTGARRAGELSDEEATAWEDELVERLMDRRSRPDGRSERGRPRTGSRAERPREGARSEAAPATSGDAARKARRTSARRRRGASPRADASRSPAGGRGSCSSSPAGRPRA